MFNFSPPRLGARFCLLAVSLFALLSLAFAQTSVSTGGIVGTVTDPTGAVVAGAKVTITNLGTNQAITLTTTCWCCNMKHRVPYGVGLAYLVASCHSSCLAAY